MNPGWMRALLILLMGTMIMIISSGGMVTPNLGYHILTLFGAGLILIDGDSRECQIRKKGYGSPPDQIGRGCLRRSQEGDRRFEAKIQRQMEAGAGNPVLLFEPPSARKKLGLEMQRLL
jgi:hypothetical protein